MTKSMQGTRALALLALFAILSVLVAACGSDSDDSLVVYSGRTSSLVRPLLEQFNRDTGVLIQVRYASSAAIAALVLEEGDRSPADVVFLQDSGALGALSAEGMLTQLPGSILERVDPQFRAANEEWVGTSGRARTVVYNTETIDPAADLPDSILDFTDPQWKGRLGWAPANASFQAFVTGMRVLLGDAATEDWLRGILANDVREYGNNITTVLGAASGEMDVGFVNHYYLERFLEEEGEDFGARNHFIGNGDPGALILTAGAGVLKSSGNKDRAEGFIRYLLEADAQQYFSDETKEYPLIEGVSPSGNLPPISTLDPPVVDLSGLHDLRGTLDLLRKVGALD
ncbi:MAG TPA: iron ABC transporter substrate-binding protein [Dehalococcoidia bacterium]|nr:iron ABC transporter substrate-binding protein [Dehalococcoidia bacterium]